MSADVKSDYIKTLHQPLSRVPSRSGRDCAELGERARAWLERRCAAGPSSAMVFSADLRYIGQAFQIEVPIDQAWLEGDDRRR